MIDKISKIPTELMEIQESLEECINTGHLKMNEDGSFSLTPEGIGFVEQNLINN